MATKQVETYTGTRVTFHSIQPFDSIVTKLYASIGGPDNASESLDLEKAVAAYSPELKDKFVAATEKKAGPHGLTTFHVRASRSSSLAPHLYLRAFRQVPEPKTPTALANRKRCLTTAPGCLSFLLVTV